MNILLQKIFTYTKNDPFLRTIFSLHLGMQEGEKILVSSKKYQLLKNFEIDPLISKGGYGKKSKGVYILL